MPRANTNPFSRYFFLSGESLLTARKVFRQWALIRIARGEKFLKLKLKEISHSRQEAKHALNDLHEYAAELKYGNSRGETN